VREDLAYFRAVAIDYDGTLADGRVKPPRSPAAIVEQVRLTLVAALQERRPRCR
jgi:hydroxymethylpyrimidine pyrophosphatase-like HAD family hydrolase